MQKIYEILIFARPKAICVLLSFHITCGRQFWWDVPKRGETMSKNSIYLIFEHKNYSERKKSNPNHNDIIFASLRILFISFLNIKFLYRLEIMTLEQDYIHTNQRRQSWNQGQITLRQE